MRQIKFRGKRLDNGEWVYGDLIHIDDSDIGIVTDYDHWQGCRVDPETVGQFVGITDEHGKEVYEGDVLEANYKYDKLGYNGGVDPDNDCICYGVVEFDNGYLAWVINIFKCEYPMTEFIEEGGSETLLNLFGHEYGYNNCNLTVLGNRFDNPDLPNGK